jgi:hypothetical protein
MTIRILALGRKVEDPARLAHDPPPWRRDVAPSQYGDSC